MQPSNTDPNAAGVIPAAHLPQAVATASQSNNPGVMTQLQAMQAQLNAIMGIQQQNDMEDVILVNAVGRIVEVDGKTSLELLSKPGFRKATTDEEERYHKAILRQTPQYLRRMESKRLQEEKLILDEIEAEDDGDTLSVSDLLQAPVTTAQKSGTPEPVASLSASLDANTTTQAANDATTDSANAESTPKPPSRRAKATK